MTKTSFSFSFMRSLWWSNILSLFSREKFTTFTLCSLLRLFPKICFTTEWTVSTILFYNYKINRVIMWVFGFFCLCWICFLCWNLIGHFFLFKEKIYEDIFFITTFFREVIRLFNSSTTDGKLPLKFKFLLSNRTVSGFSDSSIFFLLIL